MLKGNNTSTFTVSLLGAVTLLGTVLLISCNVFSTADTNNTDPANTSIIKVVLLDDISHAANPLLLGSNTQWVDLGDGIVDAGGLFQTDHLTAAKSIDPTMLRYPGGTFSDAYIWQNGIGAIGDRSQSEKYPTGVFQDIIFGTDEFLSLCVQTAALPIITVNIEAPAADAAAWVEAINVTRRDDGLGGFLPKVDYWEIGNEPYLIADPDRLEMSTTATEYAAVVNAFIPAMKEKDNTILTGISLRSDKINGKWAIPGERIGFNDDVLNGVTAPFDYVALHNAYWPFIGDIEETYSSRQLFESTMAAHRLVIEDLDATIGQLESHGYFDMPIAITEYNTMYTIGGSYDSYINSFMTALYVADIMAVLAKRPEIIFANQWSLLGNWHFGLIDNTNSQIRPAARILQRLSDFLQGDMIKTEILEVPHFSNIETGGVAAYSDTPLLQTAASSQGNNRRVWLVNRSWDKSFTVQIEANSSIATAQATILVANELFSPNLDVSWQNLTITYDDTIGSLLLPAHSIAFVEITLE